MKRLLLIVSCFFVLHAQSQSKLDSNKNRVKYINIYGEDANVAIGKILVNTGTKTGLFILKVIQAKNAANNYTTTFYFGNKDTVAVSYVKIYMHFTKPINVITPSFSAAFNTVKGVADDHLSYIFKATRLNRDPGSVVVISFTIKSREKIVTEISGADGVLQ
ncbi:MAG: hypothetical protein JWP37_2600 [Mucilaginibacter sp.]|nr:hypothetical protein [Mucilaginibacter sp.]